MPARNYLLIGSTGLVMAAGLVSAPSAAAATPSERQATALQKAGVVQMWEDPDYSGSLYVEAGPGNCPAEGCDIDGWDGDNEISSVKNGTNCTVRLWDLDGFGGSYVDLAPNRSYSNLELLGFDNKAESFTFYC